MHRPIHPAPFLYIPRVPSPNRMFAPIDGAYPSFRPSAPARPSAKWFPSRNSRGWRLGARGDSGTGLPSLSSRHRRRRHRNAAPANPISPAHPQSFSFPLPFLTSFRPVSSSTRASPLSPLPPFHPQSAAVIHIVCRC